MNRKNLNSPDETRAFSDDTGQLGLVGLGETGVGKASFKPGWQWSLHVKPIAGTDSCQANHTGYVLSGRMHIQMDDGQEMDIGPGDVVTIPPGHDAWTIGDEPCEMVDWTGYSDYAKPSHETASVDVRQTADADAARS